MLVKLRRVGNSKGIILPAPFVAALKLEQEIELRLEDGRIILETPRNPRAGWFDGYRPETDPTEWGEVAELSSWDDWVW